jgi:hypothetical protein
MRGRYTVDAAAAAGEKNPAVHFILHASCTVHEVGVMVAAGRVCMAVTVTVAVASSRCMLLLLRCACNYCLRCALLLLPCALPRLLLLLLMLLLLLLPLGEDSDEDPTHISQILTKESVDGLLHAIAKLERLSSSQLQEHDLNLLFSVKVLD